MRRLLSEINMYMNICRRMAAELVESSPGTLFSQNMHQQVMVF